MKSVNDVLNLLPELNLTELRAVQIALDKELLKHLPFDEELYFLVFDITGEKPLGISKFVNSTLGSQWRKNQSSFDDVVARLTKDNKPRKVTLKALKKFLLELLVDHIKDKGMPLNMRVICQQLENMETILDSSFPGYLKAGLGGILVKQLEGNHD